MYGLINDFMFSKVLVKPDDQLELNEAELKMEHTRILSARNPQAPDNLITFDFNKLNFLPGPSINHLEVNFKKMVISLLSRSESKSLTIQFREHCCTWKVTRPILSSIRSKKKPRLKSLNLKLPLLPDP